MAADGPMAVGEHGGGVPPLTGPNGPSNGGPAHAPAAQPEGTQGRAAAVGKGITDSEIRIGIHHLAGNFDQVNATFGASNNNPGDPKRQAQLVVDHVNANGGIAGREVVPVFHGTDPTVGGFSEQAQTACAKFTEDNEVFAVISQVNGNKTLDHCLAKRGTPLVLSQPTSQYDRRDFDELRGFLYQPGRLSNSRLRVWIDVIDELGYFDEGAVVAILRLDDATSDRTSAEVVRPALAARGTELADEAAISFPSGVSGLGAVGAQAASAVLRFRAAGVTHVMLIPSGGVVPFFFMPEAESQNYRPRYALTSGDALQTVEGSVPEAQLLRAAGAGWSVARDVPVEKQPTPRPATAECLGIMQRGGVDVTDPASRSGAFAWCANLLLLDSALERASELSVAGLLGAIEALGADYQSADTYATFFGPRRYDGVDGVLPIVFDEACGCLNYTGGLRRAP